MHRIAFDFCSLLQGAHHKYRTFHDSIIAATSEQKVALSKSINQVLGIDNRKFLRLTKISYGDPEAGDITII
jgi:hypothetical protein